MALLMGAAHGDRDARVHAQHDVQERDPQPRHRGRRAGARRHALYLSRSQALVDDQAYMKGMIPHHSIAILTSERADIDDVRVRGLADGIIAAQRKEIEEMDWLIDDIDATAPPRPRRRPAAAGPRLRGRGSRDGASPRPRSPRRCGSRARPDREVSDMTQQVARIGEPWCTRTPYGSGETWQKRVDTHLANDLSSDDIDGSVQSASILHSNRVTRWTSRSSSWVDAGPDLRDEQPDGEQ